MKLTVTGDINSFYVQTLCMIFFPGEKFNENQEITCSNYIIISFLVLYIFVTGQYDKDRNNKGDAWL